jgi:transposase InsO family protein
MGYEGV